MKYWFLHFKMVHSDHGLTESFTVVAVKRKYFPIEKVSEVLTSSINSLLSDDCRILKIIPCNFQEVSKETYHEHIDNSPSIDHIPVIL